MEGPMMENTFLNLKVFHAPVIGIHIRKLYSRPKAQQKRTAKKGMQHLFSLSLVPESLNGIHRFRVPLGWLTLSPELRPATVPCT